MNVYQNNLDCVKVNDIIIPLHAIRAIDIRVGRIYIGRDDYIIVDKKIIDTLLERINIIND